MEVQPVLNLVVVIEHGFFKAVLVVSDDVKAGVVEVDSDLVHSACEWSSFNEEDVAVVGDWAYH